MRQANCEMTSCNLKMFLVDTTQNSASDNKHLWSPCLFWWGLCCLSFLVFHVVLLCVLVPCCDVRGDFHIIKIFGSSLTLGVCRRPHVLFPLCVFICPKWCPTHIVLCFCCVCRHPVYTILSVSLDCPFMIAPSIFFNVFFKNKLVSCYKQINLFLFDFKLVIFHLSSRRKPGRNVPQNIRWTYK